MAANTPNNTVVNYGFIVGGANGYDDVTIMPIGGIVAEYTIFRVIITPKVVASGLVFKF